MIFHWTRSLFVGLATFDTSLTTTFSQFGEWLELLWSYHRANFQVRVAFSNVFPHQGSFANLHRTFARACRGQEDNQPPRTRPRDWSRPDEREADSSEASCHPSLRFGVSEIKEILMAENLCTFRKFRYLAARRVQLSAKLAWANIIQVSWKLNLAFMHTQTGWPPFLF